MALVDPRSNEIFASKLYSASIVGATTPHASKIWIRVFDEGEWCLVVSPKPFTGDLARLGELDVEAYLALAGIDNVPVVRHRFTHNTNLTHTFMVEGLEPDKVYYYALMTDDLKVTRRTEIGYDRPKWFRTLPVEVTDFSFGFYSCHDHISADGSAGAWPHFFEQLEDAGARFVIGGGDQMYVDTNAKQGFPDIWKWLKENKEDLLQKFRTGKTFNKDGIYQYLLDIYRCYYRVYWQLTPLKKVFERFPQYMIWDDHEIMDGWGSYTKQERLNRLARMFRKDDKKVDSMLIDLMWQAATTAYYEYEHSHNPRLDGPPDRQNLDKYQWDYAFACGDVAYYVLDMRGHHDIEADTDYKILGEAQFNRFVAWLDQQAASATQVMFVVSPVPVLHWVDNLVNYADLGGARDDFRDEWDHEINRKERRALLEAVFSRLDAAGKTLVFLSGDVHCASVFKLSHKHFRQAKVFQMTSSAISRKPAPKPSILGITSGGPMKDYREIFSERLFALAGDKNFSLIKVIRAQDGRQQVLVDLCWPGGDEGEVVKKRIVLK